QSPQQRRLEHFRHLYEVARELGRRVRRERRSAIFGISALAIEGRQLLPQIYHRQLHDAATAGAAPVLRGRHQARTQPCSLNRGIHREQPEIAALAPQLHIYAPRQRPSVDGNQEFAFGRQILNFRKVDTVAVDEELLRLESEVDERHDLGGFLVSGGTYL